MAPGIPSIPTGNKVQVQIEGLPLLECHCVSPVCIATVCADAVSAGRQGDVDQRAGGIEIEYQPPLQIEYLHAKQRPFYLVRTT